MSKIVCIPDLHVGKGCSIGKTGQGSNLNSRIIDQMNLLDWCLDLAHDEFATDIIATGDCFEDSKPDPILITLFIGWLKRCRAMGIRVHLILGNHDIVRSGATMISPLDIISEAELEGITVYKDISTLYFGNTSFTLMPFRDRRFYGTHHNQEAMKILQQSINFELASIPIPFKKVVIGHLAIKGAIPVGDEIDDIANELFCPTSMFAGFDYVWMGHVHSYQVMQESNPHVAHLGSMDISNFGEGDQKKFVLLYDCENNSHELRTLPTRQLRKISIKVPKDTEDTTAFVMEEIKKEEKKRGMKNAIVRLDVSLEAQDLKSLNKTEIEKILQDFGTFNITGISEQKKVSIVKRDTTNVIDTKMDVSSAIKSYADTYVEEKKRESFTELAMSIFAQFKAEIKEKKSIIAT